jgi:hypothetical protein
MYKINTNNNRTNNNRTNNNRTNNNRTNNNQYDINNNINNLDTSSKLLNEDMINMRLLSPQCNSQNILYKDFYNNTSKLKPVAPYRLGIVKHPKNGIKQVIEYRNFYSDSTPNARKYNAPEQKDIEGKILHDSSRLPMFYDSKLKLYEETRRKNDFAKPIASNSSNKLSVMYNDCLNKTTFNYNRFGNRGPDDKYIIDNPIYSQDISKETNSLNKQYMDSIKTSAEDLYASVFEDMYFLTTDYDIQNHIENDEIERHITSLSTKNLQKSY